MPSQQSRRDVRQAGRAPDRVVTGGRPAFGSYQGAPDRIDLSTLTEPYARGPVGEFLRHKRWMYVFAATDEVIVSAAVVDAGPTATTFLMAVDRKSGEVIANASRPGAPRPLVGVNDRPRDGHLSRYRAPGTDVKITGDGGRLRVRSVLHRLPFVPMVDKPWIELDLTLEIGGLPTLLTVSDLQLPRPLVSTTVKGAVAPTGGTLRVRQGDRVATWSLDGGSGGYDYTNGYLPRRTSWNWAFGSGRTVDGRDLGLNLVSGFTGLGDNGAENCLWLDGELILIDPAARIEPPTGDLTGVWRVTTLDGSVDLRFEPHAAHHESLNLMLLRSRFVQALGRFTGRIDVRGESIEVAGMAGAAEDQDVLW